MGLLTLRCAGYQRNPEGKRRILPLPEMGSGNWSFPAFWLTIKSLQWLWLIGKARPRQLDEYDTDLEADNEDKDITGQIAFICPKSRIITSQFHTRH